MRRHVEYERRPKELEMRSIFLLGPDVGLPGELSVARHDLHDVCSWACEVELASRQRAVLLCCSAQEAIYTRSLLPEANKPMTQVDPGTGLLSTNWPICGSLTNTSKAIENCTQATFALRLCA